MSRLLTDPDLLTWEVYATTGPFGLPDRAKIVFNCLTDAEHGQRFVEDEGDVAEAQRRVLELSDDELGALLAGAGVLT